MGQAFWRAANCSSSSCCPGTSLNGELRTLKLKKLYESNQLYSRLKDATQYTCEIVGIVSKLDFGDCTRVHHGTQPSNLCQIYGQCLPAITPSISTHTIICKIVSTQNGELWYHS